MDACLSTADLKVSAVFFGIPVDFRLSVARACPVVPGIGCPLPVKPPLLFRVAMHDYLSAALATSYSQASPLARSSSPGYWASIASSATTIRPVSTLVRR
jgi:hypothetical protein